MGARGRHDPCPARQWWPPGPGAARPVMCITREKTGLSVAFNKLKIVIWAQGRVVSTLFMTEIAATSKKKSRVAVVRPTLPRRHVPPLFTVEEDHLSTRGGDSRSEYIFRVMEERLSSSRSLDGQPPPHLFQPRHPPLR
ncbi:hypothetical protein E2C01_058228 [Portunus trituberculatus]|uniref:Uncharacterized protein n=1 Tax=Portunus trituberculatus TaxID=210409 RepID=A0A5B7H449_PORTR|nr:hypothetical protein [Portunus trituberculatus]